MLPFPDLQPALFNLQRVIAERHFCLWVLQENGLGYFANLQHLALMDPTYATGGWPGWRTVQVCRSGLQLTWDHGVTLNLKQLRNEVRSAALSSHPTVRHLVTQVNFYRPLMHCVPSNSKEPVSAETIVELYGISDLTLNTLTLEYAAPPALLYHRLLDLFLALSNAFSISMKEVRDWMHWTRHPSTWSMAGWGPSPFAAIERGELIHVEHTLYPHPTYSSCT